jgi:hypothetical protein
MCVLRRLLSAYVLYCRRVHAAWSVSLPRLPTASCTHSTEGSRTYFLGHARAPVCTHAHTRLYADVCAKPVPLGSLSPLGALLPPHRRDRPRALPHGPTHAHARGQQAVAWKTPCVATSFRSRAGVPARTTHRLYQSTPWRTAPRRRQIRIPKQCSSFPCPNRAFFRFPFSRRTPSGKVLP